MGFTQGRCHEVHRNIPLKKGSGVAFDVDIWDDEGFTSWENVNVPLRCLRVREVRKEINAKGEVLKCQEVVTHFVTNASRNSMKALTVSKIAQQRWDIENTGFHLFEAPFPVRACLWLSP